MRTSLIISTYNWPEALNLVLTSVSLQHHMPDEVLVADDGSTAPTALLVKQWADRLPVPLHHIWQEDKGYRLARSRNRAIAAACGEYVITIDGDMVLHPDFVRDHIRASERGFFVQGPRVYTNAAGAAHMLERSSAAFTPLSPGIRRRHIALRNRWLSRWFSRNYVTTSRVRGCNQAFWRTDLIAVNGFEERMIGWGPEDKECVTRLQNAGIRGRELRFAAIACHLDHASRAPVGINPNDALFEATVRGRKTWCEVGIDQHLTEFAGGVPAAARPPWSV